MNWQRGLLLAGINLVAAVPLICLLAIQAWLWWFGLLLWIPVHAAWQSTLDGFRRLSI